VIGFGTNPKRVRIFWIVHVDNLPDIVERGELWAPAEMVAQKAPYVEIGNRQLTRDRANTIVPDLGVSLDHFIARYFCPRSVMLYHIRTGNSHFDGTQEEIVHLVASVEAVISRGLPFAFTDQHARLGIARFFFRAEDLKRLDWGVINSQDFANTREDPHRAHRKQAEFLVQGNFPIDAIEGIGCCTDRIASTVSAMIRSADLQIPVQKQPEWYF
jgi:hypothetical protein